MSEARSVFAYLVACVTGAVLVSIANTHVVLSALSEVGADFSTATRIEAIQRDLAGFGPTLLLLLAIGFVIAFPVAGLIARWLGPGWRRLGFTLAGGATVIAMMLAITAFYHQFMDGHFTPIASSRTLTGLLTLSLGGGAAGFLFATLTPGPTRG